MHLSAESSIFMAKRVIKALTHPRDLLVFLISRFKLGQSLSDERYLRLIYRIMFGKKLNLNHPETYNEKLQWLKLNDRNPLYPSLVDKITAKDYIRDIIGKEFIIPTLAVFQNLNEIDLDKLPEQFVLKTNHSGGNTGVVICRDKKTFDLEAAKKKLRISLNSDMFSSTREWPYTQIKPTVFAEQLITDESSSNDLKDYKFFCFDGIVKALFVGSERSSGDVKFDFFDAEFKHLDLVQTHPMSGQVLGKPKNFEKMKEIAEALSKGIPHVRVDLYNVSGKIYFGELTFYHHGGFQPFHPESWDRLWGKWLKLPDKESF